VYCIAAHPPVVTITPLTTTVHQGDQVTFLCSATGVAADTFVYGWLLNGVPVRGQRNPSLVVTSSEDTAGNYYCTVRNVYGDFNRSRVAKLILSKCANNSWCLCAIIMYSEDQFCQPVTVSYNGFNVTWNETLVGVTVEAPCTGPGLNGTNYQCSVSCLLAIYNYVLCVC